MRSDILRQLDAFRLAAQFAVPFLLYGRFYSRVLFHGIRSILYCIYFGMNAKLAMQICVTVTLLTYSAIAQVPGDFNCNGQVNGNDSPKYWSMIHSDIMTPIDTASCFWRNGDFNGDGYPCTIVDAYQLVWYLKGENYCDSDAYPAADSIILSNDCALPGATASIEIKARVNPMATLYQINIKFDSRYLHKPSFKTADGSSFSAFICDTSVILISAGQDIRNNRNRPLGILKFDIDKTTPPYSILNLDIYNGCYFPTGIGYYSMPAYFVPPAISGGRIFVYPQNVQNQWEPGKPAIFAYPNIIKSELVVTADIPDSGKSIIEICDIERRPVALLFDGEIDTGRHAFYWHPHDHPNGEYLCKLSIADTTLYKKVYLKK